VLVIAQHTKDTSLIPGTVILGAMGTMGLALGSGDYGQAIISVWVDSLTNSIVRAQSRKPRYWSLALTGNDPALLTRSDPPLRGDGSV